jgi:anti-anti-sigma factor
MIRGIDLRAWAFAPNQGKMMEISEERQGEIIILSPAGRINNDTSPVFQTRLTGSAGSAAASVVVDFSQVEYISSAGLRALMIASKQAKAINGRLAVAALTPIVKEIFAISHFGLVVQVFETTAEAVAALSQRAGSTGQGGAGPN